MKNLIEAIIENSKKGYRESIVINNNKLEEILLNILTDTKKLQDICIELDNTQKQKNNISANKRYTYEQVKQITKIQLKLAQDKLSMNVARREILNIADFFPVHNLPQYNKRLKEYLSGIGSYGFAFPSNWAKALLEETNYNKLVLQALQQQQNLYYEKDGKINNKLAKILEEAKQNNKKITSY